MKPSKEAYNLIKQFEGCRLKAYNDPATGGKPITIGWGSIMKKDGNRFILGDTITQQEADSFLEWEVNNKANTLNILVKGVMLRQNQFDALVSFIYNLGVGNLSSSTLLKKIKVNPSDSMIRLEFLRWNKANHKVMGGLTRRRQAEADLYFKPE